MKAAPVHDHTQHHLIDHANFALATAQQNNWADLKQQMQRSLWSVFSLGVGEARGAVHQGIQTGSVLATFRGYRCRWLQAATLHLGLAAWTLHANHRCEHASCWADVAKLTCAVHL